MKLNEIRDNPGAHTIKTKLGRGLGSGKGQTAGRGQKGQKARTGVRLRGFEGGQMPIYRRIPKRGFVSVFRPRFAEANLDRIQDAIDAGRLDPKQPIDAAALQAAGVIGHPRDGLRLLGRGEIKAAIRITVDGASASAVAAVERAGGAVAVLPKKPKPEGKLKPKAKSAA